MTDHRRELDEAAALNSLLSYVNTLERELDHGSSVVTTDDLHRVLDALEALRPRLQNPRRQRAADAAIERVARRLA